MTQDAQSESSEAVQSVSMAMAESWLGILLAAPIFGVTCVIFSLSGGNPGGWFLLASFAVIVGSVLALLASMFAMAFILILNWSLANILSPRLCVIVFGGLSGFTAAAFLFYGLDGLPAFNDLWIFNLPALGVVAAMVFGQIGGLWWPSVFDLQKPKRAARIEGSSSFQFQIRHLLVGTVWMGLIFALDQGWMDHELIKLVAFYVVAQFVLLLIDRYVSPVS